MRDPSSRKDGWLLRRDRRLTGGNHQNPRRDRNLEIEPQRVAAFIEGKPIRSSSTSLGIGPYRWPDLISDWASETGPKEKTKYSWTKIINKLIAHVGHNDAAAVTEADLIGWKNKLVSLGLSPTTIKNHLTILRTLYNFARDNALTGHKGEGSEGREYGEYYVGVLCREICNTHLIYSHSE